MHIGKPVARMQQQFLIAKCSTNVDQFIAVSFIKVCIISRQIHPKLKKLIWLFNPDTREELGTRIIEDDSGQQQAQSHPLKVKSKGSRTSIDSFEERTPYSLQVTQLDAYQDVSTSSTACPKKSISASILMVKTTVLL